MNNIPLNTYADFFVTHAVPKAGANPSNVPGLSINAQGALTNGQVYTEFIQKRTLNDGSSGNTNGGSGSGCGLCSTVQLVR